PAGMNLADAQRADAGVVLQFQADADRLIAPGLVPALLLRDDRTVRVEQLHHRLTANEQALRVVDRLAGPEPFACPDEELDEGRIVGRPVAVGAQTGRRRPASRLGPPGSPGGG